MATIWYWRKPRHILTVALNYLTLMLIWASQRTARLALQLSPGVSEVERAEMIDAYDARWLEAWPELDEWPEPNRLHLVK